MDTSLTQTFEDLNSQDDPVRLAAFKDLLAQTEQPVPWAYEVWDLLTAKLEHPNSYQRSIAIMLLCNLAQSDPQGRLNPSIDAILAHTRDEKFITSRQTIQALWKIAWFNPGQRQKIVEHLKARFQSAAMENHANLLRQDVIQSLYALYKNTHDETLFKDIHTLIAGESEPKYQKAYLKTLA